MCPLTSLSCELFCCLLFRMVSEDPILVCRRRIRTLEQEHNSSEVPPWKKELLQKKIEQIKDDIIELEEKERKKK